MVKLICNIVTFRIFKYEPYGLAEDVVKDYIMSHMNTSRCRYRKLWFSNECNENQPPGNASPSDWRECHKLWSSEEGKQLSKRIKYIQSCVGSQTVICTTLLFIHTYLHKYLAV